MLLLAPTATLYEPLPSTGPVLLVLLESCSFTRSSDHDPTPRIPLGKGAKNKKGKNN